MINGQVPLSTHMDSLFGYAIGNAFWKDREGKFLGANQNELDFFGFSNFDFLIGRGDRDLVENAEIYMQNDQDVMSSGRGMILIEPHHENKTDQFLTYKAPLLNNHGKIIGIFGIGYALNTLISHNTILQARILHEVLLLAGPSVEKLFKQALLEAKQIQLDLSKRQIDCLELLARGMTYNQIADFLSLSKRTVEHYIEAIKLKWGCECRYSLIKKFMNI